MKLRRDLARIATVGLFNIIYALFVKAVLSGWDAFDVDKLIAKYIPQVPEVLTLVLVIGGIIMVAVSATALAIGIDNPILLFLSPIVSMGINMIFTFGQMKEIPAAIDPFMLSLIVSYVLIVAVGLIKLLMFGIFFALRDNKKIKKKKSKEEGEEADESYFDIEEREEKEKTIEEEIAGQFF